MQRPEIHQAAEFENMKSNWELLWILEQGRGTRQAVLQEEWFGLSGGDGR